MQSPINCYAFIKGIGCAERVEYTIIHLIELELDPLRVLAFLYLINPIIKWMPHLVLEFLWISEVPFNLQLILTKDISTGFVFLLKMKDLRHHLTSKIKTFC